MGANAEGRALNLALLNDVNTHQLNSSRTFRKSTYDILVVDNDISHDNTPQKNCSQVGFTKSGRCPCSNRFMALSQEATAKFKLLGI